MKETGNYKEIIKRSHERSIQYGVDKDRPGPDRILKGKELDSVLAENEVLVQIAKPFMEILYNVLRGSGFSIYLTDRSGVVLTIIGDGDILEAQTKVGIVVGADMSEKSTGTNSMGAALHEDRPIQTSGEDHFIKAFYIWTCSAAVVHDERGSIIGCLNLTGRRQSAPSTHAWPGHSGSKVDRASADRRGKQKQNCGRHMNTSIPCWIP